jgi:hypothetical protein
MRGFGVAISSVAVCWDVRFCIGVRWAFHWRDRAALRTGEEKEAVTGNAAQDASEYTKFVGLVGKPRIATPLESDELRRFVQAIMDDDPAYYDPAEAAQNLPGEIVAPPLYPLHAFRRPPGTPDPLQAVVDDPDHDAIGPGSGTSQGLPPIPSPFKRLLNGGNEIEFFRCLRLGEQAVAKPRYQRVELKQGRSGPMLIIVTEVRWETETGELLMINRQTSIRR